jgi:hypothetical protein
VNIYAWTESESRPVFRIRPVRIRNITQGKAIRFDLDHGLQNRLKKAACVSPGRFDFQAFSDVDQCQKCPGLAE